MAVIEAISTVYMEAFGAEASYIIFDDIPDTYKHLEIRVSGQTNRATYGNDALEMRMGDDADSPLDVGGNYSYITLETDGTTTAFGHGGVNTSIPRIGRISSSTANAANFGVAVITVMDYANTNKFTTVLGGGGNLTALGTTANSVSVTFNSVMWNDTAAVNAISLFCEGGTGWMRGSCATLYGIND